MEAEVLDRIASHGDLESGRSRSLAPQSAGQGRRRQLLVPCQVLGPVGTISHTLGCDSRKVKAVGCEQQSKPSDDCHDRRGAAAAAAAGPARGPARPPGPPGQAALAGPAGRQAFTRLLGAPVEGMKVGGPKGWAPNPQKWSQGGRPKGGSPEPGKSWPWTTSVDKRAFLPSRTAGTEKGQLAPNKLVQHHACFATAWEVHGGSVQ